VIRPHLLPLAIVLTVIGCATTRVSYRDDADFVSTMNARGDKATAKVVMKNGTTHEARALRLEGDSISFLSAVVAPAKAVAETAPEIFRFAADEVHHVEFVSHVNGAVEGLSRGAVGGFLIGFAFGAATAHRPCSTWFDLTCGSLLEVGAAYGMLLGAQSALVGLVAGGIKGRRYRYDFVPRLLQNR